MASTIPTTSFDEEEVRILLLGNSLEINRGLTLIERELQLPLAGWVRERFPGLQPLDLAQVWAEALANLYEQIQEGKFDPDPPLIPFLKRLLWCRAADLTRRGDATGRKIEAIAARLRETQTGQAWKCLDEAERREILEEIRRAIQPLPPKQKIVFDVWLNNLPETESMEELMRLTSETTGEEETLAGVKRALQEARKKTRERLQDRGFGF